MWGHRSQDAPRVFGHRGAMGHCPENTFASFERAVQQGVDAIELDIHLTRDDRLAVIHDHHLDRTTSGSGTVRQHLLAEIQALDAGSHFSPEFAGERVPELDEVLDWARDRCVLDIEIKGGYAPYPGISQHVVRAIQRHSAQDRVIVISFDHPTVAQVKGLAPDVATGVLWACRPVDPVGVARAANADAILPHWTHCYAEDVSLAHAAGISVHPWATSEPAEIESLIDAGVDSICSNHPDRVIKLVRQRGAR
ncbi:MAG: glycerophosphodiester phosphodiesterase family protein [Chloroflexota bacterium]